VIAGVVADLETVPVQLTDLIPGEVVRLVRPEAETLGDEKRRAEAVLLELRPDDRVMTRLGVVERQHDELVGDRFQRRTTGQHREREHRSSRNQGFHGSVLDEEILLVAFKTAMSG
jgi:hypothetical protein